MTFNMSVLVISSGPKEQYGLGGGSQPAGLTKENRRDTLNA